MQAENDTLSSTPLDLCLDTLETSNHKISLQREYIQVQDDTISMLIKQRNEAYSQSDTILSGVPWYVWTAFGIASGIVLGETVIFK